MDDLLFDDTDEPSARPVLTAGVTRGVVRMLRHMGFSPLTEFKLTSRRRIDVAGLDARGRFLFAEVKSSVADFRADGKWMDYLPCCDWFYFAVPPGFPLGILPDAAGIIRADAHDGVIERPALETPVNGNRRRTQLLRFARAVADRLSLSEFPQLR
ncbi:MAG: MmcB family DNA repair protein [Rhodospirillaceae bacterium]